MLGRARGVPGKFRERVWQPAIVQCLHYFRERSVGFRFREKGIDVRIALGIE